jgi:copper(I)-binding protein
MAVNKKASALALVLAAFAIPVARPEIAISGATARAMPGERVEVYFVLRNDTPRRLELLKAESRIARTIELKQRSYGPDSTPRVWPVAKIEVAPGAEARFLADGRFFLLTGVSALPAGGEPVTMVLTFEDQPPVTVRAPLVPAP